MGKTQCKGLMRQVTISLAIPLPVFMCSTEACKRRMRASAESAQAARARKRSTGAHKRSAKLNILSIKILYQIVFFVFINFNLVGETA